jgi:hypothetical protein
MLSRTITLARITVRSQGDEVARETNDDVGGPQLSRHAKLPVSEPPGDQPPGDQSAGDQRRGIR